MAEKKVRVDAEQEERDVMEAQMSHGIHVQPRKHSYLAKNKRNSPEKAFMSWSICSLLICFCWGVFAIRASSKVQKYNDAKDYDRAAYYSRSARRLNVSAIACFIVTLLIFGVPYTLALATQGSIKNFPTIRSFFG